MDPVSVSVTIDRPREEVFAYLLDMANRPEFCDHYLRDWRMTREETVGRGAGGRFRIKAPFQRFGWADATIIEVQAPWRIVEGGRGGKENRTRLRGVYELEPGAAGTTRVTFTVETRPKLPTDRFMETVSGQRGWFRRKHGKALRRLRAILEDGEQRGARATIAGR